MKNKECIVKSMKVYLENKSWYRWDFTIALGLSHRRRNANEML